MKIIESGGSCRSNDAIRIRERLRADNRGRLTISELGCKINRSVRYVRSVVEQFEDFEFIDMTPKRIGDSWLTDADLKYLRGLLSLIISDGAKDLVPLQNIIARLTPPPPVEWVDRGDACIAESNGHTLMAWKRPNGWDWRIADSKGVDAASIYYGDRIAAKAAAEARLVELMRTK